jgi:hypothetical protein
VGTRYVVKPGDTLSKIALAYHLPSFRNIYDDPENKKFKASHPNPNVIFPGDVLMIPSPPILLDPITLTVPSPSITRALDLVYSFAKKKQRMVENSRGCFVTSQGEFSQLDRKKIAAQLAERVMDPTKIYQGHGGLCVPAALVYDIAKTRPEDYVKAVTELFDNGQTTLGKWKLTPNEDLKRYALPKDAGFEADWIILASIRDSENWFSDYSSVEGSGETNTREYKDMLSKAGFTDIQDDNSGLDHEDADNLKKADELYSKNYHVTLWIDAAALRSSKSFAGESTHAVVLASNIRTTFSALSSPVSMDVFTWGGTETLPHPGLPAGFDDERGCRAAMTLGKFLNYYYGYTAAKF